MRNRCFVALGVALVVGFMIAGAQARPPGDGSGKRGGGPRVGGARPGNVRPGNIGAPQPGPRNLGGKLQSPAGGKRAGNRANVNFQNKVSRLKTNFTPAKHPFTPAWYANHPRAWRFPHPHADVWAAATIGVAAAWLGIDAASGDAADGDTVYTGETGQGGEADENDQAAETESDEQTNADDGLGASGGGDYLPLGVFALAPKSEQDASAVVQLAVDKQGNLRGNYYDVLTGQGQAVVGTLDKKTQRATFAVSPKGNVSFETTLEGLTQPTGSVTLRFQNGETRQWTLARFDNPAPPAPTTKR